MNILNAVFRLEAMSFNKKDAERAIIAISRPMWKHFGKLFATHASPELVTYWTNEIFKNYLVEVYDHATNIKGKKSKVSLSELEKWLASLSKMFAYGAGLMIEDDEYASVPKRFKTDREAEEAAESVNIIPVATLISADILSARSPLDLKLTSRTATDWVLKAASRFD